MGKINMCRYCYSDDLVFKLDKNSNEILECTLCGEQYDLNEIETEE